MNTYTTKRDRRVKRSEFVVEGDSRQCRNAAFYSLVRLMSNGYFVFVTVVTKLAVFPPHFYFWSRKVEACLSQFLLSVVKPIYAGIVGEYSI